MNPNLIAVRVDADLDRRVEAAAEAESITISEFARRALRERAEHVLGDGVSAPEALKEFIGAVDGGGIDDSLDTGAAFREVLDGKPAEQG